jgi:hypothetical protein
MKKLALMLVLCLAVFAFSGCGSDGGSGSGSGGSGGGGGSGEPNIEYKSFFTDYTMPSPEEVTDYSAALLTAGFSENEDQDFYKYERGENIYSVLFDGNGCFYVQGPCLVMSSDMYDSSDFNPYPPHTFNKLIEGVVTHYTSDATNYFRSLVRSLLQNGYVDMNDEDDAYCEVSGNNLHCFEFNYNKHMKGETTRIDYCEQNEITVLICNALRR